MNDYFNQAIQVILAHEGGYSDNPNDPGGPTNFGITQASLDEHWKALGLPRAVQSLTLEDAKAFYLKVYWEANHYDAINAYAVATKLFDMAVNLGSEKATRLAQETASQLGYGIAEDGILGKDTLATLNTLIEDGKTTVYLQLLCNNQCNYYQTLVQSNPKLGVFLKGWLNRAQYPFT